MGYSVSILPLFKVRVYITKGFCLIGNLIRRRSDFIMFMYQYHSRAADTRHYVSRENAADVYLPFYK
jgi:hypothetical protein